MSPSIWTKWKGACVTTERDRKNQQNAVIWLFVWTLSWVFASIALKEGLLPTGLPAIAAILLTALLGVATMLAYWKFLSEADELLRKIQLDALAFGFGAGWVGAVTYQLLERAGIVTSADSIDVVAIMAVVYALVAIIGQRRYA